MTWKNDSLNSHTKLHIEPEIGYEEFLCFFSCWKLTADRDNIINCGGKNLKDNCAMNTNFK